jgi:orotate phosphoribosyltransferase
MPSIESVRPGSPAEAEQLLRDAGALLEGHFQLTSGKHSLLYVEKFRLLERPPQTDALCRMIADWARQFDPQLVAGPTTGGVIISYVVARLLGTRGIFAESDNGGRAFKRGFQIDAGERVLIVDDVLSTGGSLRDVIDAVRREGGEPCGIAALVDRTAGKTDFGLPFFACLSLEVPAYDADDCPGCRDGTPLLIT